MNGFAKKYFNMILIIGALLGFVMPEPGPASGTLILAILALIIFASSFKVAFSVSFFKSHAVTILVFYTVRFLLLPVVVYYVLLPLSPLYAMVLLLLLLMPAGVTSPAFTGVFDGNVSLALVLLMLSSGLVPVVVPFVSNMVLGTTVAFEPAKMFGTLFLTVVFPYLLHLPFRKVGAVVRVMQHNDAFVSIFGIGVIFTLAIAAYKQVLIDNPTLVLPFFAVGMVAFLVIYAFGWWGLGSKALPSKIALLFVSGANNVALGLVVTFLYFPKEVGVFFVVCELVWVVVMVPVKTVVRRLSAIPSEVG